VARELTIGGTNRWADVIGGKPTIRYALTYAKDTLGFELSGDEPGYGQDVALTDDALTDPLLFAGHIVDYRLLRLEDDGVTQVWRVECDDYTTYGDRLLVVEVYEDVDDASEIVLDLAATYMPEFDTSGVMSGAPAVGYMAFDYKRPSEAMKALCAWTGWHWYVDFDMVLHFFDPQTLDSAAPMALATGGQFNSFTFGVDTHDLRNRIYVQGGTELSDAFSYSLKVDGEARTWALPHKPHELSMTVGGAPATVGIEHVDDESSFAYMMNYQEKYVRCSEATATPAASTVMAWSYRYDRPIITMAEDVASQAAMAAVQGGDGVYEHLIVDDKLTTTEAAQARAEDELRQWANPRTACGFVSYADGWRSGQLVDVDLSDRGASGQFLVFDVTVTADNPQDWRYQVNAGSRLKGVADLLRELAEGGAGSFDETAILHRIQALRETVTLTDTLTVTTAAATPAVVGTAVVGYSEVT
jgi:hypothetical protein